MSFRSSFTSRSRDVRGVAIAGAALAVLAGIYLLVDSAGDGLMRLSFDFPLRFAPQAKIEDVVIVQMDEQAHRNLHQTWGQRWDRRLHAKLLRKLKADGARLAVFDVFLADPGPPEEDGELISAIGEFRNVVLAAVPRPNSYVGFPLPPGYKPKDPIPPAAAFAAAVQQQVGVAVLLKDKFDTVFRQHRPESTNPAQMTLPWVAARLYGAAVASDPLRRREDRWIRYYGPYGAFEKLSYDDALNAGEGYFRNKTVFIGGKPSADFAGTGSDEFPTPYTRWTGMFAAGVEVIATVFTNLKNDEWLYRISPLGELGLVCATGLLFGAGLSFFRPLPGATIALGAMLAVATAGILSFWFLRTWFDWALIAGVQIPVAWTSSALLHSRRVIREQERLNVQLGKLQSELDALRRLQRLPADSVETVAAAPEGEQISLASSAAQVSIPDCKLIKCIGEGAYGEVWLGWNVTSYRAVKLVFRAKFQAQRPFDREFEGLSHFEPVSRLHPGWVNILHVGKDDRAGFFYYEMEPADDLATGRRIDPEIYVPKTLSSLLVEEPWLALSECVRIGIALADAVAALHHVGLVHRDIKPSNIIFVNGAPKLADIGLVAKAELPKSFGGTEGFIPSTNIGTPRADIFSLGRLLYQAATGAPPSRHPSLPTSLMEREDAQDLMRLMELINKACSETSGDYYSSAAELRDDLLALQSMLNPRRARSRAASTRSEPQLH